MADFSLLTSHFSLVRIAAVITCSPAGKIRQNLDRMLIWIKAAKEKGVAVVCFPEMNITGYSISKDIISTSAEPVPGPISEKLLHLAEKHDITILAGMAEKDSKGRIFASHLVAKPDRSLGVYRKLHIAPPERPVFSAGNNVPLFEAGGVKFGIQLCYDAHFPELSTCMAVKGADLIFIPHASPRGRPEEKYKSWIRHLPARAYDNSVFVAVCNQAGDNENGLCFPGIALVIDPSGNITDKNLDGRESMIVADLKSDTLARVRNHKMRFFLPNRRPELYQTCGVSV